MGRPLRAQQGEDDVPARRTTPSMGDRIMRRLLASLTVASLFVLGCSPSPTGPVARMNRKVSFDCSNGNNGNNPPNTANGGCGNTGNNSPQNSSNNPPTTAGN
jgi:hypothetical protein